MGYPLFGDDPEEDSKSDDKLRNLCPVKKRWAVWEKIQKTDEEVKNLLSTLAVSSALPLPASYTIMALVRFIRSEML